MKSVFNKVEKEKSKEIEFPVLAESIHNNFVVLFTDETSGIVMKNSNCNPIGDLDSNYVSVTNESRCVFYPQKNLLC